MILPAGLSAALACFALLAVSHAALALTFIGSAAALLVWTAALYRSVGRSGRALVMDIEARKQHWLQACAQGSLLVYWGWYTPVVYAFLPFIAAQLVFAYAFDSLLMWSRRDKYTLGFAPFPVIFSINLFLWFKLDWFFLQLALVAVGLAAKELIRWTKDGRSAHIFNPSSFPLGVFSLALLLTGTTNVTFGYIIANTQFDTPHLYLAIFLVTLPAQLLFGVARMTLSAVVTTYAISLVYFKVTGTYLFYDAYIPVQVFLGMHLLFTDPSTSPRSELGRLLFGVLYGIGTVVCFVLLSAVGAPTFYDKLLPVPIMNLLVRQIDRLTQTKWAARLDPARIGRALAPSQRNVAYTGLWVAVFAVLAMTKGVGDTHPGQYLPFWQNACRAGSDRACAYGANLTRIYCERGSGWACNEVAILEGPGPVASDVFKRACDLGFSPGCDNMQRPPEATTPPVRDVPHLRDLPIVLSGTKPPLRESRPERLYALACTQGWPGTCDKAGARQ